MKLSKFLSIVSILTFMSCLYVYQQTEILRLAYLGEKRIAILEDLLDKNGILRYNMGKSVSLVHIVDRVSKVADFQMPESYRLVRLSLPQEFLRQNMQASKKENLLARLFGIKRQAEARTINPSTVLSVDGESFDYAQDGSPKDGEFIEPRSRTINPSTVLSVDGERSRTINP